MMINSTKYYVIAFIVLFSAVSISSASEIQRDSTLGRSLHKYRYNNHRYYDYERQYQNYPYGYYNSNYRFNTYNGFDNRYNFEVNRYRNPIHRAYQFRNGLTFQLHPISPLVNPNAGYIPHGYRNVPNCR